MAMPVEKILTLAIKMNPDAKALAVSTAAQGQDRSFEVDGEALSSSVLVINASESRTQNFKHELIRRGWRVEEFNCLSWTGVVRDLARYLRSLRRSRFVLAGVGFPWQGPWLLLAKIFRVKVIIDCPMDVTVKPFPEVWHWKRALGFFFRRADGFLTLASRDYMIQKFRLKPERTLFIENCPDIETIRKGRRAVPAYSAAPENFLICYSGVAEWQRIDAFVPIFKALREKIPNATWLVISNLKSPMIARLQERAAELGVLEAIKLVPIIKPYEDFIATVAQCHLWVSHMGDNTLLGLHELRMELLEMGVLARPVVSVATPALERHGFRDGENIILIDSNNAEESAEHILRYLNTAGEPERLGRNLSQHVARHFSLSEGVDRLLKFVRRSYGKEAGESAASSVFNSKAAASEHPPAGIDLT